MKLNLENQQENEGLMHLSMEQADIAIREGNGAFGVVVVGADGSVIWRDHDRINELCDPTAHGEVNSIRYLCKTLKTNSLKGYKFVTTSEPCPMCMAAMIKVQVSECVYGARTESTASLSLSAEVMASHATKYSIRVVGGVLAEECLSQRNSAKKIS